MYLIILFKSHHTYIVLISYLVGTFSIASSIGIAPIHWHFHIHVVRWNSWLTSCAYELSLRLEFIKFGSVSDIKSIDSKDKQISILGCNNVHMRGVNVYVPWELSQQGRDPYLTLTQHSNWAQHNQNWRWLYRHYFCNHGISIESIPRPYNWNTQRTALLPIVWMGFRSNHGLIIPTIRPLLQISVSRMLLCIIQATSFSLTNIIALAKAVIQR